MRASRAPDPADRAMATTRHQHQDHRRAVASSEPLAENGSARHHDPEYAGGQQRLHDADGRQGQGHNLKTEPDEHGAKPAIQRGERATADEHRGRRSRRGGRSASACFSST